MRPVLGHTLICGVLASRLIGDAAISIRRTTAPLALVPALRLLAERFDLRFAQEPEPATPHAFNPASLDELAQALGRIAQLFSGDRQQDQAVLRTHDASVLGVVPIVLLKLVVMPSLMVEFGISPSVEGQ